MALNGLLGLTMETSDPGNFIELPTVSVLLDNDFGESFDLSCNPFPNGYKYFFEGLQRKNLKLLNFSLCQNYTQSPPLLDLEDLSILPPLKSLILSAGSYKKWISTLFYLTNGTSNSLKELHLAKSTIPDFFQQSPQLRWVPPVVYNLTQVDPALYAA
ncbi:hypothetical protein RvY_03477 [Ramazzottius varieornatus]|uniref:Uncharacterized protein n=1 Tax=Ramazzottius varieornatus TaxID=947166 RepID=A0A1D1UYD2_RAMVA|nr:hypothetical protein RvY_03477 [Ramazzottius varieornatus]